MKLLDATEGLRMTITCTAFQFVFFSSTLNALLHFKSAKGDDSEKKYSSRCLFPENAKPGDPCIENNGVAEIEWLVTELLIGHIVVFVMQLVPRILKNFISVQKWYALETVCKIIVVFVYGRTLFLACSDFGIVSNRLEATDAKHPIPQNTLEGIPTLLRWV